MIKWKKSNAVISLRSERKPGLFKTQCSFVLSYYVEIIRVKNNTELQTGKSHEEVLHVLNKHINNTVSKKLSDISDDVPDDDKVVCRKLIVQDVVVNHNVYNKYLNSKTIPLLYNRDDPNVIKFS
jgi:hypothetical protein